MDLRLEAMWTQEEEAEMILSLLPASLMGLGTASGGTPPALLAAAAPRDGIWGLADAWT